MAYKNYTLPDYPCTSDMWDNLISENLPIVVYGMGNGADKLITRLEKYGLCVSDFFASDGFVRGHCFHGKRVKSFSEIKQEYDDFIILLSFASNRPDVIDLIKSIDDKYRLFIPDMPVAGEEEYFDREFYNANYLQIKSAYDRLCDTDSKNAFAAIVNYKLTGKMEYLLGAYSEKEEVYSLINESRNISSIIDAGAYNGDTLKEATEFFPHLSKAFAIEADVKNYKRLLRTVETLGKIDVTAINGAVWCEEGTTAFSTSGNRNSSVSSTTSYQHKTVEIPLITIDNTVSQEIDYIKYDVEGAEYEALIGSDEIIKKYRPVILVSVYHRSKDLFFLTNYLAKKYNGYDFYLRRLLSVPAWEADLIMIPKDLKK